ncbi:MAG: helix-turn-helix domain-containing protein [Maricaulaceae bacterium]
MTSDPKFIFGNSYAIFFPASSQNVFSHNVAFQIVLSANHDISIVDEHKNEYSGRVILIKPLVKNKIKCDGQVTHLYLSPRRLSIALDLENFVGEENIHVLKNAERLPFKATDSRDEIIVALDELDKSSFERLDSRLLAVLEDLNQNLDNPSILNAAKRCGLSRSRIRTLAREQIGIPLSTWVMWRKLVKANKALSCGANLSDAALAGHFADQAHFNRTMKRMFGVTPTEASRVYT